MADAWCGTGMARKRMGTVKGTALGDRDRDRRGQGPKRGGTGEEGRAGTGGNGEGGGDEEEDEDEDGDRDCDLVGLYSSSNAMVSIPVILGSWISERNSCLAALQEADAESASSAPRHYFSLTRSRLAQAVVLWGSCYHVTDPGPTASLAIRPAGIWAVGLSTTTATIPIIPRALLVPSNVMRPLGLVHRRTLLLCSLLFRLLLSLSLWIRSCSSSTCRANRSVSAD